MTNVPAAQFTQSGLIIPQEADVLTGVMADYNEAFGGDMNMALTTPQGQLATSTAKIISEKNSSLAYLMQMFDPATSSGIWQDALGKLYFLTRIGSQSTIVNVTCLGLSGTIIPVDSLCIDSAGNQYISTSAGTIPAGGSVVIQFAAIVAGPIVCPVNDLKIYRAVNGWDSVTNTLGIVGRDVETRAQFETRRQESVSLNAVGILNAVRAKILSVAGVIDAYPLENNTSSPVVNGSITLLANSIYVCVAGGTDADIAAALHSKKMPGCNYTGDTSVTVYDTSYPVPYPSYLVKFQRATALSIKFAISIQNSSSVPTDAAVQIQNAIINAMAGLDGGTRGRIGATLFASRYYSPVALLGAWAQIISLKIGTTTANLDQVVVPIHQIPEVIASDIVVTLV
jgi:hypothetical protein